MVKEMILINNDVKISKTSGYNTLNSAQVIKGRMEKFSSDEPPFILNNVKIDTVDIDRNTTYEYGQVGRTLLDQQIGEREIIVNGYILPKNLDDYKKEKTNYYVTITVDENSTNIKDWVRIVYFDGEYWTIKTIVFGNSNTDKSISVLVESSEFELYHFITEAGLMKGVKIKIEKEATGKIQTSSSASSVKPSIAYGKLEAKRKIIVNFNSEIETSIKDETIGDINNRRFSLYNFCLSSSGVLEDYYEWQEKEVEKAKSRLSFLCNPLSSLTIVFKNLFINYDDIRNGTKDYDNDYYGNKGVVKDVKMFDVLPSGLKFGESYNENNECYCTFELSLRCINPLFYLISENTTFNLITTQSAHISLVTMDKFSDIDIEYEFFVYPVWRSSTDVGKSVVIQRVGRTSQVDGVIKFVSGHRPSLQIYSMQEYDLLYVSVRKGKFVCEKWRVKDSLSRTDLSAFDPIHLYMNQYYDEKENYIDIISKEDVTHWITYDTKLFVGKPYNGIDKDKTGTDDDFFVITEAGGTAYQFKYVGYNGFFSLGGM